MNQQDIKKPLSEERIKEKYMEFKLLQEHIEKITEHVNLLMQQQVQIEETKEALQDLACAKIGSDILVPVADGVFVKASLGNTNKLLVNVGSNIVVPRTVDEVTEMISSQQQRVTTNIEEAKVLLEQFESQAMEIYKEVEQHVR